MRLTGGNTTNNEKGFTLVELMVVLSIMGIVLAAAYNFFFFTQKSYALADARSAAIQDVDLLFLQLEKDIRSASAPNTTTRAVNISDDSQQIDIYTTKKVPSDDDPAVLVPQYCLTSYRLQGTEIERGFIASDEQSAADNPQYGGIPDTGDGAWKTIVNDVLPGEMEIFSDRNDGDNISSRRLIDVDLYVRPAELNNSINMKTSLLSRSGRSTASITESTSSNAYKEASYIKFYGQDGQEITSPLTVPKSGGSIYITARAFASDGTDATTKNILFKQNLFSISWSSFPDYALLYDDKTGDLFEVIDTTLDLYRDRLVVRSGQSIRMDAQGYDTWIAWLGNPRQARIQAVSPDGPTATLYINQPH